MLPRQARPHLWKVRRDEQLYLRILERVPALTGALVLTDGGVAHR